MDRDWSDIMSLVVPVLLGGFFRWVLAWSQFVDDDCCLSLDFRVNGCLVCLESTGLPGFDSVMF